MVSKADTLRRVVGTVEQNRATGGQSWRNYRIRSELRGSSVPRSRVEVPKKEGSGESRGERIAGDRRRSSPGIAELRSSTKESAVSRVEKRATCGASGSIQAIRREKREREGSAHVLHPKVALARGIIVPFYRCSVLGSRGRRCACPRPERIGPGCVGSRVCAPFAEECHTPMLDLVDSAYDDSMQQVARRVQEGERWSRDGGTR